jgi:hypothetical protein
LRDLYGQKVSENEFVTDLVGLTPAEHFVLEESDGDVLLWELLAAWTNNGDQDQPVEAVPLLADALVNLARHGLIEVHVVPAWPLNQDEGVAVSGDRLARAVGDVNNWLWRDDFTSVIVVSLTDVGVPWL